MVAEGSALRQGHPESMRSHWADSERSRSGFDEYEGVFGPLAAAPASFPGRQRDGHVPSYIAGGRARPSRRRHARLPAPDFDRREKFLVSRSDKRRQKQPGARADGSSDGDEPGKAAPVLGKAEKRQVWLPARSFAFRQRAGKLDTRAIARLDLGKIAATTDVEVIQRHLENLAFADVTLDDVQQYSDAYFLKLFQIAQLTLEYLMHVQDSLVGHSESLESQCERLLDECQQLEADNDKQETEITSLKRDIRQKQRTMATMELMLLNASSRKLPTAANPDAPDKENVSKGANALVEELLTSTVHEESGSGLGQQPIECVLCEKRFVSVEYLLRHQEKKHQRKHRRPGRKAKKKKRSSRSSSSASSGLSASSSSGSRSSRLKQSVPQQPAAAAPPPTPLPKEVLDALEEKNQLARQLVELQSQVRAEQDTRDSQRRQTETQQNHLTAQVMEHLGQLQSALVAIERKQEAAKLDMIKHTDEAIKRMQEEATEALKRARQTATRVGTLESDQEESAVHPASASTVKNAGTEWSQLEKVMDTFLRAQALKQQEIDVLQQQNAKLASKATKRNKQRRDYPEVQTTLLAMAALDAARFGVDYGQTSASSHVLKRADVDEKTVQTDEEELKPKVIALSASHTVQTDQAACDKQAPPKPAILVRSRSSLPTPTTAPTTRMEKPARLDAISNQIANRSVSIQATTASEKAQRQAAERVVGKAVLRHLRSKQLKQQSAWQLVTPVSRLEQSLRRSELNRIHRQNGEHISLQVTRGMTANRLRREIASVLSGDGSRDSVKAFDLEDLEDAGDDDGGAAIAVGRVLLRHKSMGVELCSETLQIHLFKGELEVEILPDASEKKDLPLETTRDPIRGVTLLQAQVRGLAVRRKFLAMKSESRRSADATKVEAPVPTHLVGSNKGASTSKQLDQTPSRLSEQCGVIRQRLSAAVASRLSSKDCGADTGGGDRSQAEVVGYCLACVDMERKKLSDRVQERIEQLEARCDAMLPEEMVLHSVGSAGYNDEQQQLQATRRRLDELLFGIRLSKAREEEGAIDRPRALFNELIESVFPQTCAEGLKEVKPISGSGQREPARRESANSSEIQALADAYELDQSTSTAVPSQPTASKTPKVSAASRVSIATASQQPVSRLRHAERSVAVVARAIPVAAPASSSTASRGGRPGTPTLEPDSSVRGSPPLETVAATSTTISPFSKTPLISRRARMGNGFDNAR